MGADAKQIADGLSEAQRRYLTEAFYGRGGWRIVGYRKIMVDKGLCLPGSSVISPLGLQVRAALEGVE